jgi:hypothetical protein
MFLRKRGNHLPRNKHHITRDLNPQTCSFPLTNSMKIRSVQGAAYMEGNILWDFNTQMLNNLKISLPTVTKTGSAVGAL